MRVSHRFTTGSARFDEDNLVSDAGLVPLLGLAEQTGLARSSPRRCRSRRRGSSPGRRTWVYAPSTLWKLLREFSFGHARQLLTSLVLLVVEMRTVRGAQTDQF